MSNIYWPVFKNIESEINELMFDIHFDDDQLNVYSSKISDLILRASTEIESISKELYYVNGGEEKKNLKYDYDCLKYLNDLWKLEEKQVILSSYNSFFSNRIIQPFKKDVESTFNKELTYGWNNAYQNLKHDRSKSLKFGSVNNLLKAVSALYVLNIYKKEEKFELGKNRWGLTFDNSLGSSLFSVKLHFNKKSYSVHEYLKNSEFDECIYLSQSTKESTNKIHSYFQHMNGYYAQNIKKKLKESQSPLGFIESLKQRMDEESIRYAASQMSKIYPDGLPDLEFEAVLNKNQF